MFCSKCGTELIEGNAFCTGCGEKIVPPTPKQETPATAAPKATEKAASGIPMGKAGMILGIIGTAISSLCMLTNCCCLARGNLVDTCASGFFGAVIAFFPVVLGVVGLILSCISRKKSRELEETNKEAGIGLLLSVLSLVLALIAFLFGIFAPSIISVYGIWLADKR